MIKIFIDSNAGLCPGVNRAINEAVRFARNKEQVYSYGDLVHNQDVLSRLAAAGINTVHDLTTLPPEARVIIRAHGITPADEAYIKEHCAEYIDLTCHLVKNVHKAILQNSDTQIVIIGDANHPETIGHLGYAAGRGLVIKSIKEADELKIEDPCLVIAQTTTSYELFMSIVSRLKNKYPHIKIKNTICTFVVERQEWIKQYAAQCTASLIIGGKNSSNTGKLYEIATQYSTAFWIKNQDELDLDVMKTFDSLALTAGTSTPNETINRVIEKLYNTEIFPVFIG